MPAELRKRMLDRLGFTVPEMISAAKRMYVPSMYVCMFVAQLPATPALQMTVHRRNDWGPPASLSFVSDFFFSYSAETWKAWIE